MHQEVMPGMDDRIEGDANQIRRRCQAMNILLKANPELYEKFKQRIK